MYKKRVDNVFAILAHDNPRCLEDTILNIGFFDASSRVLIYDASPNNDLRQAINLPGKSIEFVKNSQQLHWGDLLEFPLACIEHLGSSQYDTITFFDSDQLLIAPGYTDFLSKNTIEQFGVLSSNPFLQGADSNLLSVRDLHSEWRLWQSYIESFSGWQKAFVRSTFWPGTVLSATAGRDIVREIRSPLVSRILRTSKSWATEECIIPTISYLLGHVEQLNPCNRNWCTFRTTWSTSDLFEARRCPSAFYMHPVPRDFENPVRQAVRKIVLQ